MKDTIVAISTTLGVGAISIVRMSGDEAIEIANKIYKGKNLSKVESNTINYGHIYDGEEVIDEVLVSVMKAPRTYTVEDVVEINCHGGISVTNKVLELCIRNGARMAEPGEFTKRAFLNGRIDLLEAESVMDLINGSTEKARKVAIKGVDGETSYYVKDLRNEIVELLASIEVNIDYPEYDAPDITNKVILSKLGSIKSKLENIVNKSENGIIIKNGIKTIIIGKPNVGKSSILNKLLNEDKAIVTDIAGTTRDTVEGSISINGVELDIIDTAGIRETDNVIESIGVEKSLSLIDEADLIIAVFNNNEELDKEDKEIIERIKGHKVIAVINKIDLENKLDESLLKEFAVVKTTTTTIEGIKELTDKIVELFNLNEIEKNDYRMLSNVRQITLAKQALECINNAYKGIEDKLPEDLVEIDIKDAWTYLGDIIGESYGEELIDELFTNFCLGK